MLHTTNTASAGLPGTYTALRIECESLLKIAKELESKALGNGTFSEDPEFVKLKDRYREQHQSLISLLNY